MFWRMIKNDVMQSKLITIVTTVFVMTATMSVALAVIIGINLFGSIDTLMKNAETAHYMQMHAGEVDEARLEKFVGENENIESFEVSDFLNIDGAKILFGGHSFADSVIDNGVSTQNEQMDFLLDVDNQRAYPNPSEIYVPISLKKDQTAKIGEKMTIAGKEFVIKGFIRDSEMNSPMAGSQRFLVHQQDFDKLESAGSVERIIQFRLKDVSKINELEAAYQKAKLEMNGPAGTYHLFRLISAMSDGIMIAILLLVSLLVVLITFMCIRFTLLAKIESDYREIGVMKAIGLQNGEIKKLYLAKYTAIAVIGSLLGYIVSLPVSSVLLKEIKMTFGESENGQLSKVFAAAGIFLVLTCLILYVSFLLNRFKKVPAVEAIRFSTASEEVSTKTRGSLRQFSAFSPNVRIGLLDIMNRKKMYVTMLLVFIFSSFLMLVPWMTYQTISADSFVEFIGFSEDTNLMINLYESVSSDDQEKKIEAMLEKDPEIEEYTKIVAKNYQVVESTDDGILRIELGNHQKFSVDYTEGEAPDQPNEIALSSINAEEYGKKVGDTLTILKNGKKVKLRISGIYTNAFSGGKTAKASFEDEETEKMWSSVYVKVKSDTAIEQKKEQYQQKLPFAKVNNAQSYKDQAFGGTIRSIFIAAVISLIIAVSITALITSLFLKMLLVKDKKEIALLKALGYTNNDLSTQYLSRSLAVLAVGLVTGTLLSMTLGKILAGVMVSFVGLTSVEFSGSLLICLGCPLIMMTAVILATKFIVHRAGDVEIAENLKD